MESAQTSIRMTRYAILGFGFSLVTAYAAPALSEDTPRATTSSRQAACESYRKRTGKIHPKCTEAESFGTQSVPRDASQEAAPPLSAGTPRATTSSHQAACEALRKSGQTHPKCTEADSMSTKPVPRDASQVVPPTTANEPTVAKGAGPDILGIQIGMSPSEIRPLVKGRPTLKSYQEYKGRLAYRGVRGETKAVPNSEYIAGIHGWSRAPGVSAATDALLVTFSAEGGKERAIAVSRVQHFPSNETPTLRSYEEGLNAKFGPPNFRKPGGTGATGTEVILFWYFDSRGTVSPRKDLKFQSQCSVIGVIAPEANEMRNIHNPIFIASPYDLMEKQCGAYGLAVTLNATRASGGKLVDRADFRMAGYPAILAARRAAEQLTANAQRADVDAGVKAAAKVKPAL